MQIHRVHTHADPHPTHVHTSHICTHIIRSTCKHKPTHAHRKIDPCVDTDPYVHIHRPTCRHRFSCAHTHRHRPTCRYRPTCMHPHADKSTHAYTGIHRPTMHIHRPTHAHARTCLASAAPGIWASRVTDILLHPGVPSFLPLIQLKGRKIRAF